MSRAVTPSSASEVAVWSTSSCVGFAHNEEPAPKLGWGALADRPRFEARAHNAPPFLLACS